MIPEACGVSDPFALVGENAGEAIRAVFCTYGDTATIGGTVLIAWFTVSTMSYVRTQSIAMPVLLLLLLGGASVTLLPSIGVRIAGLLLLGGGAAISVLVLRRLDRV